MFVFPFVPQAEQEDASRSEARFLSSEGYDPKAAHSVENMSGMRSLNVPLCMNIMAGGRYKVKKSIVFTSISAPEHFSLERSESAPEDSGADAADADENWGIRMHQHDFFELMYVLDGTVKQRIEDGCYFYERGHACLMNRSTRHFEVVGKDYIVIYLCLSKEYVRELVEDWRAEEGECLLLRSFFASNIEEKAQYHRDSLDFTPIGGRGRTSAAPELLETIARELLLKQPGYSFVLRGLVERLFACLQDETLYQTSQVVLGSSAEALLFEKVTRWMEQSTERVTRAALAERMNYSSDYINRVVKKHSGMGISEYDRMIRLKKARDLFVTSERSITEIITSLGFENKTFFYRLFQKKYGMTPMEYRRRFARKGCP